MVDNVIDEIDDAIAELFMLIDASDGVFSSVTLLDGVISSVMLLLVKSIVPICASFSFSCAV